MCFFPMGEGGGGGINGQQNTLIINYSDRRFIDLQMENVNGRLQMENVNGRCSHSLADDVVLTGANGISTGARAVVEL